MLIPAFAAADARFRDLNKEYGLSAGAVFSILQDKQGYLWLATGNGLERYDGYKFTVFKHNPNNPNSIASDFVKTLYLDASGRLWVGTYGGGLDLYQPATGSFIHHHANGRADAPSSDKIFTLEGDTQGDLLIGTYDSGLDLLDPATGKMHHYTVSDDSGLSSNQINAIFVDKRGLIWLGTSRGLDEADLTHNIIHPYLNGPISAGSNDIYGISEDNDGELLLATSSGLHSFNPEKNTFDQSAIVRSLSPKLSQGVISSVYVDAEGNIWLASFDLGLSIIEHGSHEITAFTSDLTNSESLTSQYIYSIYEDRSGLIWCGNDRGIETLDPRMLSLVHITTYEVDGRAQSASNHIEEVLQYGDSTLVSTSDSIYAIKNADLGRKNSIKLFGHFDSNRYGFSSALSLNDSGQILIGTNHNYLVAIDPQRHTQDYWHIGNGVDLPFDAIRTIFQSAHDTYYLGTFGAGLLKYDRTTGVTQRIHGDSANSLETTDEVETLLPLQSHKLLAGTFRGLFEIDLSTDNSKPVSLWKNTAEPVIQALYSDPSGNVWVGTYEGLWRLRFDANGVMIDRQYYPQVSGANSVQILAIEQDSHQNLWLASNNALMRFNPETGDLLSLGKEQGMPHIEYYSYTHGKTPGGIIWFGGASGLIGVNPDLVKPNYKDPAVVINDITTYSDNKSNVNQSPVSHELMLTYQDSIVTFDVSATDYAEPEANTYSYRLLGFRTVWTTPSTNHLITFTNLNPGRYRLEVRAANNWGAWSKKAAALDIVVMPPWWRTWWAYTIYLLIIVGSSIGYVYSLKRKIEREQEISNNLREANEIKSNFVERLESQVQKATHELRETLQGVNLKNAELEIAQKRATEAEQVKSQFLANMSHELRTPLTGVLGYTKLLGSTHLNSEQKDYVSTIKQSSETLLAIINDTLDLSRLEAGKLLIDQVDFDLLEVIESTLELLAPTAYQKRLELVRVVPADVPLYLRGDPLRLRQVLTNLLSNAIKFTEHGSVAIAVKALTQDEREARLIFTISDTGIGIPAGELSKLFHAYARSRISTQHHVEGTGLGLAICKKLLDLMGGNIKVTSKVGSGTSFEFELVFKVQKNAEPRSRLPRKIKVLLYDAHPLSKQAWQACLARLGAEVEIAPNLESVVSIKADAAIMVLSEKELTQLGELKRNLTPALPPMLILAPRIERQALKDLSETLFHRVLSKTAREKTLYLELQSLLQTAVHEGIDVLRDSPAATQPAADAPKILVADDNRINRRLLVTMLNHAGFRVAEAGNGLELLDLAAKGPWDAALLDIHMPGMDGIETAKRLRESLGDSLPPVIAMSADVMPETRNQVLEGLMDDFMVKPFSEQELVDKLRWHLDRYNRKIRTTPQDA